MGRVAPALALLAAACATAPPPAPGQPIRVEVLRPVGPAPAEHRPLRAVLAAGVPEDAVRAARLVTLSCGEAMPEGGRREATFWALFPPGEAAPQHHGVEFFHAFEPGARLGEQAMPGTVLARLRAPPPLIETPFGIGLTRRLPACETAEPGRLQGRLGVVASRAMLDRIAWEDAWLAALPRAAMEEGRIVLARCASAPDEVRSVIAEAPPGQALPGGAVAAGIAGVPAQGPPGPVTRLTGPAPATATFPVRSQRLVRCDPPVSPAPRA